MTKYTIPQTSFHRLVREIAAVSCQKPKFKREAMKILQGVSEEMLVELFLKADLARAQAKRKTLHIDDVKFAKYITNDKNLLPNIE
jgi:histone H3/H4